MRPMLVSLLHVRGGVSDLRQAFQIQKLSSPRPWRCFFGCSRDHPPRCVFSTSVEVFPRPAPCSTSCAGLLHVRGGVSEEEIVRKSSFESSPRPWRCFHRSPRRRTRAFGLLHVRGGVSDERISIEMRIWVFSTSVEVFLSPERIPVLQASLLHVRGGVSLDVAEITRRDVSSPRPWRCF